MQNKQAVKKRANTQLRQIKEDWIMKVGTNNVDFVNKEILKLSLIKTELNTMSIKQAYQSLIKNVHSKTPIKTRANGQKQTPQLKIQDQEIKIQVVSPKNIIQALNDKQKIQEKRKTPLITPSTKKKIEQFGTLNMSDKMIINGAKSIDTRNDNSQFQSMIQNSTKFLPSYNNEGVGTRMNRGYNQPVQSSYEPHEDVLKHNKYPLSKSMMKLNNSTLQQTMQQLQDNKMSLDSVKYMNPDLNFNGQQSLPFISNKRGVVHVKKFTPTNRYKASIIDLSKEQNTSGRRSNINLKTLNQQPDINPNEFDHQRGKSLADLHNVRNNLEKLDMYKMQNLNSSVERSTSINKKISVWDQLTAHDQKLYNQEQIEKQIQKKKNQNSMKVYLDKQIEGRKQKDQYLQKESQILEEKVVTQTVAQMKNREINRQKWLKQQIESGNYINKLNQVLRSKDSATILDQYIEVSPVITKSQNNGSLTQNVSPGRNMTTIGDTSYQKYADKALNAAQHNSQIIVQKNEYRSLQKETDNLQAKKQQEYQSVEFIKKDVTRLKHLKKINSLNEKILQDDKKGNFGKIHTYSLKQKEQEQLHKDELHYISAQKNLKLRETQKKLQKEVESKQVQNDLIYQMMERKKGIDEPHKYLPESIMNMPSAKKVDNKKVNQENYHRDLQQLIEIKRQQTQKAKLGITVEEISLNKPLVQDMLKIQSAQSPYKVLPLADRK